MKPKLTVRAQYIVDRMRQGWELVEVDRKLRLRKPGSPEETWERVHDATLMHLHSHDVISGRQDKPGYGRFILSWRWKEETPE